MSQQRQPTAAELQRRIEILEAKISAPPPPPPVREYCSKCGTMADRPGVCIPFCGRKGCGARHF